MKKKKHKQHETFVDNSEIQYHFSEDEEVKTYSTETTEITFKESIEQYLKPQN